MAVGLGACAKQKQERQKMKEPRRSMQSICSDSFSTSFSGCVRNIGGCTGCISGLQNPTGWLVNRGGFSIDFMPKDAMIAQCPALSDGGIDDDKSGMY